MALEDEFSTVKSNLKQQAEREKLAAKRRLEQQTASGRLGASRAQKIGSLAEGEIGTRLEEQLGDVDFQQAQQARQERLIKEQQAFATGERESAQKFAEEERLGTQAFAASESSLARALQSSQFEKQLAFQEREFAENLKSNLFNKLMALSEVDPRRLDETLVAFGFGSITPTQALQGRVPETARFRLPETGAF